MLEAPRQLSSIRRYFGCVTKLLRSGAREVRESPEAMRAVELEMRQLTQEKKAFTLDEPHEWANKTFVYIATLARDDGRVLELDCARRLATEYAGEPEGELASAPPPSRGRCCPFR